MAGKYVCNGAKIKCPLCSKQEGKLLVTSTTILLQDKPWATEADKQKINLQFQGNCTKFSNNPPPCIGVIVVGDWQNVAEGVTIDGHAPLLENSIIMCNTGSVPITIVNHVQKSIPTNLNQLSQTGAPVPTTETLLEPKVVEFYWMDEEKKEKITETYPGKNVIIFVRTINVKTGENITITLTNKENKAIVDNENTIQMSGSVNSEGIAELKKLEITENWNYKKSETEKT